MNRSRKYEEFRNLVIPVVRWTRVGAIVGVLFTANLYIANVFRRLSSVDAVV